MPRNSGHFELIKRIGSVAYKLVLPPYLSRIHDVFHVSLLQKAKLNLTRVLQLIPLEIRKDLTLVMKPIKIVHRSKSELRNKGRCFFVKYSMEKFPDRAGNLGNERQDEEETLSFVSN